MWDGDESLGGSVLKLMFIHDKVVFNILLNCLDFWLLYSLFFFFKNNWISGCYILFFFFWIIFEQNRKQFLCDTCSKIGCSFFNGICVCCMWMAGIDVKAFSISLVVLFILTYWHLFTKDKLNILMICLENIPGYFPSFNHRSTTFQGRFLTSNIDA